MIDSNTQNIIDNIRKELEVFSNISFKEAGHKYSRGNNIKYTSVTTFIKSIQNKFNADYWLIYKALQGSGYTVKKGKNYDTMFINEIEYYIPEDLSEVKSKMNNDENLVWKPKDIQAEWTYKNVWGTTKGTGVHNYIEVEKYKNEKYKHSKKYLKTYEKEWPLLKSQADKFFEDHPHLIWIGSEIRIADDKSGISGTIDALFWNTKTKMLEIWDWKTNKKFTTSNFFDNLKYPFSMYDDCDLVKYSIQLGLYKYILENNTNLKLGDSTIVWLFEGNDDYEKIKALDLSEEINKMI